MSTDDQFDNEDFEKSQKEMDQFLAEMEIQNEKLEKQFDKLFSWYDFCTLCNQELHSLNAKFGFIEDLAKKLEQEKYSSENFDFGMGLFWIGAVAAYEGYIHRLLLNALSVEEFQSKLKIFFVNRTKKNQYPDDMKNASPSDIKDWLTRKGATDLQKTTKFFNEIFETSIELPEKSFSERLLNIRNLHTHRGGAQEEISAAEISKIMERLNDVAVKFTSHLIERLDEELDSKKI